MKQFFFGLMLIILSLSAVSAGTPAESGLNKSNSLVSGAATRAQTNLIG